MSQKISQLGKLVENVCMKGHKIVTTATVKDSCSSSFEGT
jgi:hypothetical protein